MMLNAASSAAAAAAISALNTVESTGHLIDLSCVPDWVWLIIILVALLHIPLVLRSVVFNMSGKSG